MTPISQPTFASSFSRADLVLLSWQVRKEFWISLLVSSLCSLPRACSSPSHVSPSVTSSRCAAAASPLASSVLRKRFWRACHREKEVWMSTAISKKKKKAPRLWLKCQISLKSRPSPTSVSSRFRMLSGMTVPNCDLCEKANQQQMAVQIRKINWRWVGHTLRKSHTLRKKSGQHKKAGFWLETSRKEGEEDQSRHGGGRSLTKWSIWPRRVPSKQPRTEGGGRALMRLYASQEEE